MADETTTTGDDTAPSGADAPAADVDTGDVTPTEIPAGDAEDAPAAAADVPAQAAEEPPPTEAEEAEAPDADAAPAAEARPHRSTAGAKREKNRLARALRQRRARARAERPAERRPITRLPKPEVERGRRRERRGVVVSDAMDKTIVVKVDVTKVHPRYKKVIRRSTKFHAHDERNAAKVGDVVRIVETRPLSATKRWRLAEIVQEAK